MSCDRSEQSQMIDDYLDGALSEDEKNAFEEHLFACDVCFEAIRFREKVANIVSEKGDVIFHKYLSAREDRRKGFKPLRFLDTFRWQLQGNWAYRIAFALIFGVIILAAYRLISLGRPFELEPFPFVASHTLSSMTEAEKAFLEAMTFYQSQNYEMTSQKLEAALKLDSELKDAQFYLGLAYLFQERLDESIKHLKAAAEKSPNSEKERWYLGHAYLRKSQHNNALRQFETVSKLGQERYTSRARKLIDKLESLKSN